MRDPGRCFIPQHDGGGRQWHRSGMSSSSRREHLFNPGYAGRLALGVLLPLLWTAAACTPQPEAPSAEVRIVTTSNIIADWVSRVGGEMVTVFALLPAGSDPHTFQPGARDVARVSEADIIFTVGLRLEGAWLSRLLENAAAESTPVITLGGYVDALADGDEPGLSDPHFWWDPLRVKKAVAEVQSRLAQVDPSRAGTYAQNAASYQQELDRLHAGIVERAGRIPPGRRRLVTSHETMNYFAARYGFEAIGSVFPGITTEREPSSSELAGLVTRIRELSVPAIFTETIVSDRLARAIASETGVKIVRLYSDSLGPRGSGADTYIGMMEANLEAIVQALK